MAVCTISFNITDPSEQGIEDVVIQASVQEPSENGSSLIVPTRVETLTDMDGDATLDLSQGLTGVIVKILYPDGDSGTRDKTYTIDVPASASTTFNDLIG